MYFFDIPMFLSLKQVLLMNYQNKSKSISQFIDIEIKVYSETIIDNLNNTKPIIKQVKKQYNLYKKVIYLY